jgi:hypothetical protein
MIITQVGKYQPVESFGGLNRAWSWSITPAAAVASLPLILTTSTAYGDTVTTGDSGKRDTDDNRPADRQRVRFDGYGSNGAIRAEHDGIRQFCRRDGAGVVRPRPAYPCGAGGGVLLGRVLVLRNQLGGFVGAELQGRNHASSSTSHELRPS